MAKKPASKSADEKLDFEQALGELETLVERMEQGELSLEDSLKEFERGIRLTRRCQQALSEAEQKVKMLVGEGENAELVPFDTEDEA